MPRSMTGVGRATGPALSPTVTLAVEIKSYNHRFLEISVKAPSAFAPLEDEIRKAVQAHVARGHIIVTIQQDREIINNQFEVDHALLKAYLQVAKELQRKHKTTGTININTLLAIPGMIRVSGESVSADSLWPEFQPILVKAIEDFLRMKDREGQATGQSIAASLDLIERDLQSIERLIPTRDQHYRERLTEHLKEFDPNLDKDRYYQEVVYMADRLDISEEFQRLRGHLDLFRQSLSQDPHPGRRLYFLLQEIQREANTLGVKANYQEIGETVVRVKEEIEKIREQAQNLE